MLLQGSGWAVPAALDNPFTRIGTSAIVTGFLLAFILVLMTTMTVPFPTELATALDWFFGALWDFNFMIPVDAFLQCFTIILLVQISLAMMSLVLFVKKHITRGH